VEKFLAIQNGTKNANCCFKIIYNGAVKTVCTDEEVYADTCQWVKLRAIVTMKNHCVKFQRGLLDAAGGGKGSGLLGGYNPLVPNKIGAFIGDIHVAM
jgi:hypothetical protein